MNLTPVPSRSGSKSRPGSSKSGRPGSAASKSSVGSAGRQRSKLAPRAQAWGDDPLTTPKVRSNNFFRQVSEQVEEVDGRDFGWTTAHQACSMGQQQYLRALLRQGKDLQQKCQAGNTLLHVAARSGQLEVLRFLLAQKQISINAKNKNGWTPIMWAAINGQVEVAQLLIQAAGDIFARDEKGMTALMWAAKHGHQEVAKLLLNAGEHTGRKDDRGWLATDHAQNHAAMVRLLEAMTRVNDRMLRAAERNNEEEVAQCLSEGAQVNHVDAEGRSALLWAAVHGSVTMLHLLFRFGASTRVLDSCASELDHAIHQHSQVLAVLRAADGANARLLLAASRADWPGLRAALEQCAFVNTKDADHRAAISLVAGHGAADVLWLLVKQKADVSTMDVSGWQPMHFAVSGGHVEATSLLFHAGAAVDVPTFQGDTPLDMAVRADDASLVQMLLTSVEAPTSLAQGAASSGAANALHALLAYKADSQVVDAQGQSLMHLAASRGHLAVLKLLLKPLPALPKLRQENLLEARLMKLMPQAAQADAASLADSDHSGSSGGNSRPPSPNPSPKARSNKKRTTTEVKKEKARRPSMTLTTEETLTAGHLLMLLRARKRRMGVSSTTAFTAKALNQGQSVLGTAVAHGHAHLVKPLIALQADPNMLDARGFSPVMLAAANGNLPCVVALVEGGASVTQKNARGQRALDLAKSMAVRAALLTVTVRKIAGLPRPLSAAALKPIREERRRSSAEHHRFRLLDLPDLGTAELLEGHLRALLRRLGMPKPDVLEVPVDPIRGCATGIAYLEYSDITAADKAEKMFLQAKDVKGPTGTTASLARESPCLRPSSSLGARRVEA